jgi:hypothetical protein
MPPIRPIDLQTLLMQMSQVSRDQAIEKDGPALQNAVQGAAAQKRDIESKEAVRRTEDAKDGAPPIKERRERGKGPGGKEEGAEGGPEAGESSAEGPGETPKEEIVRDPSLGTRVDLSG